MVCMRATGREGPGAGAGGVRAMVRQYGQWHADGHEACHERRIFTVPWPPRDVAAPFRGARLPGGCSGAVRAGARERGLRVPRRRSRSAGRRICVSFALWRDRKSTRLNSSHVSISYAVFCLKKKKMKILQNLHQYTIAHIKHEDNAADAL